MSWKFKLPDDKRQKLEELLANFASENPAEVREAVMRLTQPEHMESLMQYIKRRLRDTSGDEAAELFNSMIGSFLANKPIDEKPGSPRRLETFDLNNPLRIILQSIDKRVKRSDRETKTAQLSVIEAGLSGPLDETTKLTKLLTTGEAAITDEDLPQAILMKAEMLEGVREAFKELPSHLKDLVAMRWLTAPPVPWKDITTVAGPRGRRMLKDALALLVNRLREMDLFDQDDADRLLSNPDSD